MKLLRSYRRNHGLTLMETLVVISVLALLVAVLLPTFARSHRRQSHINCTNNLKQLGLAFRIWSGDNNDKYPTAVSVTNGGAMEAIQGGAPVVVFQVMSNELSTPKLLLCPNDPAHAWATNFGPALTANNVSYFVNADIQNKFGRGFLCGDDNLELNGVPLHSGISFVTSNSPIAWTAGRHPSSGNVLAADGSCQTITSANLTNWLLLNGATTMHLAVP
jgi:prepilin-type N-terminal cleavage/methylation domain-containing protein/prepilin-type processing-associated H-X9-DG protein